MCGFNQICQEDIILENIYESLNSVDWGFSQFKSSTGLYHIDNIHNIHWYPGRCVPELPSTLISTFARPGQVLFEPFVGSGTIAVSAMKAGLLTIGCDVNPLSSCISQAKISLVPPEKIKNFVDGICVKITDAIEKFQQKKYKIRYLKKITPNYRENLLWYHPTTLSHLAVIKATIDNIEDAELKNIAFVCFSSILRACSSQQNHWGYICDNMRPRLFINKNAVNIFIKRFKQYAFVFDSFYKYIRTLHGIKILNEIRKNSKVFNIDSKDAPKHIGSTSVDLIVTSPPYPGVNDYVDSQRLSMLWIENGKELHQISRNNEIGARWKRFRKKSTEDFFFDIKPIFNSCFNILKEKGHLCLIYGESKTRKSSMATLIALISECGFSHLFQFDRDIPTKRALIPRVMNESIHIFKKSE